MKTHRWNMAWYPSRTLSKQATHIDVRSSAGLWLAPTTSRSPQHFHGETWTATANVRQFSCAVQDHPSHSSSASCRFGATTRGHCVPSACGSLIADWNIFCSPKMLVDLPIRTSSRRLVASKIFATVLVGQSGTLFGFSTVICEDMPFLQLGLTIGNCEKFQDCLKERGWCCLRTHRLVRRWLTAQFHRARTSKSSKPIFIESPVAHQRFPTFNPGFR